MRSYGSDISGDEMIKSAEARLQATGMFHTTAMRNNARTSGSCGSDCRGSQEEDEDVEPPLRDSRADLLIPAQGPALQLAHVYPEFLFQQLTGRPCGIQLMLEQQEPVEHRPLQQIALFVIVRHQRNSLLLFHRRPRRLRMVR